MAYIWRLSQGVRDCAAEIVVTFKPQLSGIIDVDHLLDMLTPKLNGHPMTYRQYHEAFSQDPTRFYPAHPEPLQPLVMKPENIVRRKFRGLNRRLKGIGVSRP